MTQANRPDALEVVAQTLNGFELRKTSESLRSAIRVLTDDYVGLWWLTLESLDHASVHERRALEAEMTEVFDESSYEALRLALLEGYVERRSFASPESLKKGALDYDKVQTNSVSFIESQLELFAGRLRMIPATPTMDRLDTEFYFRQQSQVLERIKSKIHDYLARCEQQLVFAQRNSDVFTTHIDVVNSLLRDRTPEIAEMFTAAYDRLEDPKPEHLAQAGTSCRRILKAVADHLFPARAPTVNPDTGKERLLGSDQYVNRLLAFAEERMRGTVGEAWKTSVEDLSTRLDALVGLASKGVHDSRFALFEARHCAMQTYLVVGDLLRLEDEDGYITLP
jgi:hypothetical protein